MNEHENPTNIDIARSSILVGLNRPSNTSKRKPMFKDKVTEIHELSHLNNSFNNSKMLLNQTNGDTMVGVSTMPKVLFRQTTISSNGGKKLNRQPTGDGRKDRKTCWKKFSNKVVAFLHSASFSILTTSIIVLELFLDDLRILFIPKEMDTPIDLFIFSSAILFCAEIVLSCIFVEGYLFSFFNFVDVLSTASLIPYVSVLSPDLGDEYTVAGHGNSILSLFFTNSHITKTSKASLMGTKLSRFYSLLRVLRVFSLGRIYKHNINKIINKSEKIVLTQQKKSKIERLRRKTMNIRNFEEKMKFFKDVHQLIEGDVGISEGGGESASPTHHLNPVILKNFIEYTKFAEQNNKGEEGVVENVSVGSSSSEEDRLGHKIFLSNIVQSRKTLVGKLSGNKNVIDPLFGNEANMAESNHVLNDVFKDKQDHDAEDEMEVKRGRSILSTPRDIESGSNLSPVKCDCVVKRVEKEINARSRKKESLTTADLGSSNHLLNIKNPGVLRPSKECVLKTCADCGRLIIPFNDTDRSDKSPLTTILSVNQMKEKKLQFNENLNEYKVDSVDSSCMSDPNQGSKKYARQVTKVLDQIDGTSDVKKSFNEDSSNSVSSRSDRSKSLPNKPILQELTIRAGVALKRNSNNLNLTIMTTRGEKRSSAFEFLQNISPCKKSVLSAQMLFKNTAKSFRLNDGTNDAPIDRGKQRPSIKKKRHPINPINRSKSNIDNNESFQVKFFKDFGSDETPVNNQKLALKLSKRVTIRVVFVILIMLFVQPMLDDDNYNNTEDAYQYEVNRLANLIASGQTESFLERLNTMLHDETYIYDNEFEVIIFGFSDSRLKYELDLDDLFPSDIIYKNEDLYNHTRTDDRLYVDNAYFYLVYNGHHHNNFHATLNIGKIFFISFNLWCFSFFFMLDINKTVVVPLEEIYNLMKNKIIRTESMYYNIEKILDVNQMSNYEEIFNIEKFFRKTSCLIIKCIGIRFYNFFLPRILSKVDQSNKRGISTQLKGYIMVIKLRNFEDLIQTHGENFLILFSKVLGIIDIAVFETFGEIVKIDNDTVIVFFDINFLETEKEDGGVGGGGGGGALGIIHSASNVGEGGTNRTNKTNNTHDIHNQSLMMMLQNRENLNKFLANFSLLAAIHIHSRLKYFNQGNDVELNISLHKGKLNSFLINTSDKVDVFVHGHHLKKCIDVNVSLIL
jgi:hypothetical protein